MNHELNSYLIKKKKKKGCPNDKKSKKKSKNTIRKHNKLKIIPSQIFSRLCFLKIKKLITFKY